MFRISTISARNVALRSILSIAILSVMLFTCRAQDDSLHAATVIDTLPSGLIVVRNLGPDKDLDDGRWSARELVRLGSQELSGSPIAFGDVVAVDLDVWGRIYVLDRRPPVLSVFGAGGRHIRSIGRAGSGPGEFKNPIGMVWHTDEHLWIVDQGNARYVVLDTAGKLVTTHRRAALGWQHGWGGGFSRSGLLLEPVLGAESRGMERIGFEIRDALDPASGIDTVDLGRVQGLVYEMMLPQRRIVIPIPYAPSLRYALDPRRGFWLGYGDGYRILLLDFRGDSLLVLTRAVEREMVSDDDRARVRSEYGRGPMTETHLNRLIRDMPLQKPSFDGLAVDELGYLWVRRPQTRETEESFIDIFDPEGVYRGSITLDIVFHPPFRATAERLVGVSKDELGVQSVVVLSLKRAMQDETRR